MIGVNDSAGETFTLDDAQVVLNYALAKVMRSHSCRSGQ